MMPTDFIGAALFSALNRSAKEPLVYNKVTELGRLNGYRLTFKGRVLTQVHADVWSGVIELFRQHNVRSGCGIEFHSSELLGLLCKQNNAKARADLYEWITDMASCGVSIFQPDKQRAWFGPLLFGEMPKLDSGETLYRLLLHPDLCELFRRGYTATLWTNRRALGKNELGLWLHQYLCAFPQPAHISVLQDLSWQKTCEPKRFKQRLVGALRTLQTLQLVADWEIDRENYLRVVMPPPVARTLPR